MKGPVVVKVGGSLLDWPGLPGRLSASLEARPGDRLVLIVGGGRFADVLRGLDVLHGLGEDRSHVLALRVLDLTARVLADLVPGFEVVEALEELPSSWSRGRIPVLAPRSFLDQDDRSPDPLPHAWTTTTDSIAARLAVRLDARELLLLKSTPLPPGGRRSEAARLGLVDPEFVRSSDRLSRVLYQCLRDPEFSQPMLMD